MKGSLKSAQPGPAAQNNFGSQSGQGPPQVAWPEWKFMPVTANHHAVRPPPGSMHLRQHRIGGHFHFISCSTSTHMALLQASLCVCVLPQMAAITLTARGPYICRLYALHSPYNMQLFSHAQSGQSPANCVICLPAHAVPYTHLPSHSPTLQGPTQRLRLRFCACLPPATAPEVLRMSTPCD